MRWTGKRLGLAAAIAMAAAVLIWLSVRPRGEPVVRGVTLSDWMRMEDKNSDAYRAAVAEMDERCVDWLIRELDWSPTSLQTRLDGVLARVLREPVVSEAPPDFRAAAAFTLSKLGPRAQRAIPALRASAPTPGSGSGPRDDAAQSAAIAALVLLGADSLDAWADKLLSLTNGNWQPYALAAGMLHTNAAPVVPRLVRAFETTEDDDIKVLITVALRFICCNPSLCVPVFRATLTNANPQMRCQALAGLGSFGPESKPAWNDLLPLLSDDNRSVRSMATNVLRQIDWKAAEQLGVK